MPISLEVGVRKFFCGPESFTPDLLPVVGEAPEIDNYFVAAGMNSVGILTGGGIGRIVAHWILDGRPDVDVTGFSIDRAHRYQLNPRYRAERTVETLGLVYQAHFPGRAMTTARGVKRAPIHHLLADRGAYFKDVSGWEGADWYAPPGVAPEVDAADVGTSELVPAIGLTSTGPYARASGSWTCRSCPSSSCRGATPEPAARPGLRQRRGRRARSHHLHPVAQRGRHARGGPHGHQARR